MKSTKFWACMVGVVALLIPCLIGKFTGDYGLAVGSVVVAFMGGNVLNTRAALQNGKEVPV